MQIGWSNRDSDNVSMCGCRNEQRGSNPSHALGIVIMFYSYYYFSFEMSFSKILESFSSLA